MTVPATPAQPAERSGRGPRLRAALRLARRQAWRAKGASALIVLLIALPMTLLSAGAVYAESRTPTREEQIHAELGDTDAWVQVVGGYDPTRSQAPDDPSWAAIERDDDNNPIHPVLPEPVDGPEDCLPADSRVLEVTTSTAQVETPTGIAMVDTYIGDATDPALEGRFEFLAGELPHGRHEAMASPGALERLDIDIGDSVRLQTGESFTIVGVLKAALSRSAEPALFLPAGAPRGDHPDTLWFVEEWAPTIADLPRLNHEGFSVYSRSVIEEAAGTGTTTADAGSAWYLAAVIGLVAVFSGYLIVLLAGAAFSVGARRQQRSLAVAASVGAERSDLFRIVLLQGAVLGAVGGVIGAAAGIGVGAIALQLFDDGASSTFWGVHVPWALLGGILLFAIVVGTVSAIMPARAATRGDTLAALRGARKPVVARVARPLWGSLLLAIGIAATAVSGLTLAALNAADVVQYDHPLRTLCLYGVIAGPILFQVGVLLGGHWLLSLIQRVISPLGLAPRLAGRDAAAHPGRIVPAFGAIAACAFLATVAIASVGVTDAAAERGWTYQAPVGSAYVTLYTDGASEEDIADMVDSAHEAIEATAPVRTVEVLSQQYARADLDARVISPRLQHYVDCEEDPVSDCHTSVGELIDGIYRIAFLDPEDVAAALGIDPGPAALQTLRDGGALVTSDDWLDAEGSVELNVFAGTDAPGGTFDGRPDVQNSVTIPGEVLDAPRTPYEVIVSPRVAADLGSVPAVGTIVATYATAAQPEILDAIVDVLGHLSFENAGFGYGIENGPPGTQTWMWLILAATALLVIAASAVALGLARVERRPDDATLTAVGARSALRRGIAFWQALIVTGLGALTGAVAGILPVWGVVLMTRNVYSPPEIADTPWLWLGILALGLPLAIAFVSWLVPPRHPDLTRRTAIA